MPKSNHFFKNISDFISEIVGSPIWFVFSLLMVLIWLPSGVFFDFNEIWHLMINTVTTILTFLMMSLLHSSQRDWEKKIEQLESRQERTLKLLEKETKEVRKTIDNTKGTSIANNETIKKDKPQTTISSLF